MILSLLLILLPTWSWAQSCQFRSHEALGRKALEELGKISCRPNKVHLTFDDGPHLQHTPSLLQELNRRNVKTTFFISTTNITPGKTAQRNLVKEMMDQGHLVANHGHRHEAYDLRLNSQGQELSKALTERERQDEIDLSVRYLNEATAGRFSRQVPLLFRFPYGRGALPSDRELDEMERRGSISFSASDRATRLREYRKLSAPLHAVAGSGFGHLLWNHDSEDSTNKAPGTSLESRARFVANNVKSLCQSSRSEIVSLFHDIKSFNPEAVAAIIDVGQCLGLSFVPITSVINSESLRNSGTYIRRDAIQRAPVEEFDAIADLLRNLESPECKEETTPSEGSCYSESLNRYFRDCEAGAVSICIRGKWFQRTPEKEQECRGRGL